MDLSPALAAHARRQFGLFTAAQAQASGVDHEESRRLLARGAWCRVRRGVYCESSTLPTDPRATHVLHVRAAMLRLSPPVAVSHLSAAAVYGIDLLHPDFSLLHLTRPNISSSRTDAGIHHHRGSLRSHDVTRRAGLVMTTAARTVVDFAREVAFEQGVVAAESALHRKLVTVDGLLEVHLLCLERAGSRNVGRVIAFASEKSATPGESLARLAFEALGLPMPAQQVKIYDRAGLVAIVDFLWEEQWTIGEFDGRLKYVGQPNGDVLYAEKRREDRLRALGFEVVRFGYREVRGGRAALRRAVLDAFARAAARRPSSALG